MIQSVIESPQVLASNSSMITFQRDTVRTKDSKGCKGWLCHKEGSPIYKLVQAGKYCVNFSGTLFSGTQGTVAVGLYEDGVLIPSSVKIANVAADGFASLNFNKIEIACCKANSTITVGSVPSVINLSSGATVVTQVPTIYNANLTITRL